MNDSTASLEAPVAYLAAHVSHAEHRIYPPASGRELVRPEQEYRMMRITDCRHLSPRPTLSSRGFELAAAPTATIDFYDDEAVRMYYYPAVIALLKAALGARAVVVFDHNQRSARRAAAGEPGVRTPVAAAHVDYTPSSGPRRAREILDQAGLAHLADHHLALINVWRPIVGPVQDMPLALCDARSTRPTDFIETAIHHFGEDDIERPRLSGQIYSLRYNPLHRWYYVSDMRPSEALLIQNWDSQDTTHSGYMPHTGFRNPTAPADSIPRESIEARTLVVYP
ncbi:MAG: CmcJ/NvfI family oxidoreductase [Gammaproteobacteria bacterium]